MTLFEFIQKSPKLLRDLADKRMVLSLLIAFIAVLQPTSSHSQVACDLNNYLTAYVLNVNDYPYFSPSSGITVDALMVPNNTLGNFTYNCDGNTFNTATPAFWLNTAQQVLTFTFSEPVTSFSIIVNGTNTGEEFYFAAATGTVTLSNFCTAGFTAINGGQDLECTSGSTVGSLITINNPTGSTVYTLTHSGTGAGSRYALLDCFVSINTLYFSATNLCEGDSTDFIFSSPDDVDSVYWDFDDPITGIDNNSTDSMPSHVFSSAGTYDVSLVAYIMGDPDTIVLPITINSIPNIFLGNDTILCNGGTLLLDATTTNANYLWQDNSMDPTYLVSDLGTYWVEVTVNGCSATDTIVVSSGAVDDIYLGDDTPLCAGETMELSAFTQGATYVWQDNSTQPTLTIDLPGTYWVDVTLNGCTTSDTINISSASTANINLGADSILCEGEILVLSAASSGATYLWQDNSISPNNIANEPGLYWVAVTNFCGTVVDSISVAYNPLPVFSLGEDTTLCEGETLTLDVFTPIGSYDWQDNTTNPTYTVSQPGFYWVELTENNCSSYDTIQVGYIPLPTIDFGPDFELCDNETFLLNAAYPGATYVWHDDSVSPTYLVDEPGTYYLTSTFMGCVNTDTVNVSYNPLPIINLGVDTAICEDTQIDLDAFFPNSTYSWQNGSQDNIYTVDVAGTYHVYVEINDTGCNYSDSIRVETLPLPTIDLGSDTTVCQDSQFLLTPLTEYTNSLLWKNGLTSEFYMPINSGIFGATAFNDCGSAYDEMFLQVDNCDCNIFVPNGFTPDGDGRNEVLIPIIDNCNFFNYQFRIFDRWGREVFTTDNPQRGWNASQSSDPNYYAQGNVYVWIMTYDILTADEVDSRQLMGHVTLIR